jgi:hypothetical protein
VVYKSSRLSVVLLLLVMATSVKAGPTMSNFNESFVAGVVSPTSESHIFFVRETIQITEPSNSHLANIGVELLRPPADFTNSPPVGAQSLPPVPAALFMVLTGFLCVSLVKDRRFWLGSLAGLLWAGQTGIQAIPKLAAHISSKKHIQRKSHTNTVRLHQFEESLRLRSEIEGTKYIGLLHHLAGIPNTTMSSVRSPISFPVSSTGQALRKQESRIKTAHLCCQYVARKSSARTRCNLAAPHFAILHLSPLLLQATNCLAPIAKQYIHFSPGFTFAHLARGPPNPA